MILLKIIAIFGLLGYSLQSNVAQIGNYKISKITVSGVSSGGAMATQLHVAHSGIISGSGNIAGPPYYCSEGNLLTALTSCMAHSDEIKIENILNKIKSYQLTNLIDDLENLKNHFVYLYGGLSDNIVKSSVVKYGETIFKYFMNESKIKGVFDQDSSHGMITDFFGSPCNELSSYFINNCNYNQAYDLLNHLHPEENIQNPSDKVETIHNLFEFDQNEFIEKIESNNNTLISMDSIGYIYIPKNCELKECKLHIAFHGCTMGRERLGNIYANNAGYNQVADLNNFIILYPQAKSTTLNPNGCWDWFGFSGENYATKTGLQIRVVKSMIDRLTSLEQFRSDL